jgi:hypothetical protein
VVSTDLAITFAAEHSQAAPGQGFWLQGGGVDVAASFRNGLGIAASVTGDHASSVSPGVDVNKMAYLAGPRYTWTAGAKRTSSADNRRLQIFAQGLFGWVHAFGGIYPDIPAASTKAISKTMQAGGGLNLNITKNVGVRLLQADYVRMALPNAASNIQNDLRLSFGATYHIGKRSE